MTRILLTGSTGRLGRAFLSQWQNRPNFHVHTLTRKDADLCRPDQLANALRSQPFDVLVNPAAVSGLEECLDNPAQAYAVNVLSPTVMAEICHEKNARFVHFSTDYVFDGISPGKKSETDSPSPVNVYGKTKLQGEQTILNCMPSAIIARVSWLFGPTPPERPCHFDQVLDRASSSTPQQYIHDKFSMPTFTHDVVHWTKLLIENDTSQGIYHLCNSGNPESWYSSAVKLCEIAANIGTIAATPTINTLNISNAQFFREKRPIHTAMQPARLINEGIASPRHWLDTVIEYLEIR